MVRHLARLRPRTIRARLAVSIAGLLAVALVTLGVMTVQVMQNIMIDQLDDQIFSFATRPPGGPPPPGSPGAPPAAGLAAPPPGAPKPAGNPPPPGAQKPSGDLVPPGPPKPAGDPPPGAPKPAGDPPPSDSALPYPPVVPPAPTSDTDPTGRQIYMLLFSAVDGRTLLDAPSGFRDRPDPPPRIPQPGSPEMLALLDHIVTVPAVDDSLRYRVLFRRGPRNDFIVIASSMRVIDAAIGQLVQSLLLAGAAALIASILASSWLIRRGLAPVSQMIDTASAIAGGDLSRRVPAADPASELGQLGTALNEMLGQIEAGIKARLANEERLRRFVADAAHELRTPLTSLRGYAELYQQGACPDTEAVDAVVRRIASAGARMARLVDDLLLLARLDHHQGIVLETVDLTAIVRDAVMDFQIVHPDRPLFVQLDGPTPILGDRGRLHQIVGNLLANARTHTPAGTPVRVSTERVAGYVRLTVADDGPGIAFEDQPYVFERFWRADPSRVRQTGGTGLGLSIVSSLVQAHGGTIHLESTPGQGAAFVVQLPLTQGAGTGTPSTPLPARDTTARITG